MHYIQHGQSQTMSNAVWGQDGVRGQGTGGSSGGDASCQNILSSILAVQLWNLAIKQHWCQIYWRSMDCGTILLEQNFIGYWHESVKLFQFCCKCLPASVLIDMRKILFWRKMFYHSNVVLHILAAECLSQPLLIQLQHHHLRYCSL